MNKEVIYFASAIILLFVVISLYNRNRQNLDATTQLMTVNANNNLEFTSAQPIYTLIEDEFQRALTDGASGGVSQAQLEERLTGFYTSSVAPEIERARGDFVTTSEFNTFKTSENGLGGYMKTGPTAKYTPTITEDATTGAAVFQFAAQ